MREIQANKASGIARSHERARIVRFALVSALFPARNAAHRVTENDIYWVVGANLFARTER